MSADGQDSAPSDDFEAEGSIRRLDDDALAAVAVWRLAGAVERNGGRLDRVDENLAELRARVDVLAARQDERHSAMAGQLGDVRHEVKNLRAGLAQPGTVERVFSGLPVPVRAVLLVLLVAALVGGDDLIKAALRALGGRLVSVDDVGE